MNNIRKRALLGAAAAGIMGAALASSAASAKDKKDGGNVPCWGVNKCGGHAHSCTSKGSCAGKNSCKGQGWLAMPKDSCDNIKEGPQPRLKKAEKAEKPDAQPMKDFGSK